MKKEGVCKAILPKIEVAAMEKNNRFIKLLLFPVGSDDYILLYGFSSIVEKKTRAWSQRKTHKVRQIICTAILSSDEADKFEHDLTVPGKLTVGKVSFSSPQLVRRSPVLCYLEDQTESNPVAGCGQLTELWQVCKDSQLQKVKDTYKTEGKELYKDIQALLSWAKQECGIDFSAEGRRFGNFERYEISRFHNAFDIVFHKELGNKKITVKIVMPLTKDLTVNCVATHRGRQLINQIKYLRAGEHMLEFSADEPMSRVELHIWESESGNLIFNNDITLITKICLDMNIGETPYRISEPWSEKLLKSAANRRGIIKGKIETVERNSFERRLNISSDTYDKIDVAMEEGNQLLSGYHQKQCQGAYIATVGNDGEINSFLKIKEYIEDPTVKRVVIADPYFSLPSAMRFFCRISRTDVRVDILTSLGTVNPDTGKEYDVKTEYLEFIQKNATLFHRNLSIRNLLREKEQVFHDRYLIRYHTNGKIDGFLLSNSLNSMGQRYPFVIAPLEYEVCLDVCDYLNWMSDPAVQEKRNKKERIHCEVWFDSDVMCPPSPAKVMKVSQLNELLARWYKEDFRLTIPSDELSQVVSHICRYWSDQPVDTCRALCELGTIEHPWDVRDLAAELLSIDNAAEAFLKEFPVLAREVERMRNHLAKGIYSSEHTLWALLTGSAQPDRLGFHQLYEHAGHIWYSGENWMTGGYRLMLALSPIKYVELIEDSKSPLMFDTLAAHMLFYPWSEQIYYAVSRSELLCMNILASEWMFNRFQEEKISVEQIGEMLNQLTPQKRIFQITYLLSRSTFYTRITYRDNNVPSLWHSLRVKLLDYASTAFVCCSEVIREQAIYWLHDCEECSCCRLYLDFAEKITEISKKNSILDKAIEIAKDSLLRCTYEKDLSENLKLLIFAMEQRYGVDAEDHLLGKIVEWNAFSIASEPELKNYNYHRWHSAYVRACWQIELLRTYYKNHPEARAIAEWLNEWEYRMECK